jgi:hypothetical protein
LEGLGGAVAFVASARVRELERRMLRPHAMVATRTLRRHWTLRGLNVLGFALRDATRQLRRFVASCKPQGASKDQGRGDGRRLEHLRELDEPRRDG